MYGAMMPQAAAAGPVSREVRIQRTVYIGNLNAAIEAQQLMTVFEPCGPILLCRLAGAETHPNMQFSRTRFAFVEFTDFQSAQTALGLDQMQLADRQIRVSIAKSPIVSPTCTGKAFDPQLHAYLLQPGAAGSAPSTSASSGMGGMMGYGMHAGGMGMGMGGMGMGMGGMGMGMGGMGAPMGAPMGGGGGGGSDFANALARVRQMAAGMGGSSQPPMGTAPAMSSHGMSVGGGGLPGQQHQHQQHQQQQQQQQQLSPAAMLQAVAAAGSGQEPSEAMYLAAYTELQQQYMAAPHPVLALQLHALMQRYKQEKAMRENAVAAAAAERPAARGKGRRGRSRSSSRSSSRGSSDRSRSRSRGSEQGDRAVGKDRRSRSRSRDRRDREPADGGAGSSGEAEGAGAE